MNTDDTRFLEGIDRVTQRDGVTTAELSMGS